uniref:Ig-like domain-containing protein n=1 Tax=Rhodnius prolixus TaxID=13249 RepID=T1HSN2_RHOPR
MSTTRIGSRTSLLIIESLMADHTGDYTLLPFIIPFAFEENNYAGETVQLNCFVAKGELPLKIYWNFHGEELSSHMGMSTTRIGDRTSLLTIESLMAAHSGNYTCTAENSAGSASFTANLLVSG